VSVVQCAGMKYAMKYDSNSHMFRSSIATDGGRIALTLFGRGAKLLIGNVFLLALLAVGLIGSDLFLFYFTFCIAFQPGNEVPARNEVDRVAFSRVVVAMTAYVVALLSLIPFQ
jgi:hypothetical protein